MQAATAQEMLVLLRKPIRLDISLNDLRIILGCFRAVAYLMDIDGEPYLDAEALELHRNLERRYGELLDHMGDCPLL